MYFCCHHHLYVLLDEVEGDDVLGAPGDDHVGVFLGRDAEFLEGGLDEGRVLKEDVLQVPPSLRYVTENSSRKDLAKNFRFEDTALQVTLEFNLVHQPSSTTIFNIKVHQAI